MRDPKEIKQFLRWDDQLEEASRRLEKMLPSFIVTKKLHRIAELEPEVLSIIGYYPGGKWQLLITGKGREFSVIKGMISFGDYEVLRLVPASSDPERFNKLEDLAEYIKNN